MIKSILWKLCERCGVQFINIVVQIVLARLIAPDQFALLTLILVFYNFADLFVQKGFGTALIRKDQVSKEDKDSVFVISSCIAVVMFSVLFVAAPFIADFYNEPSLIWPLRVMAGVLLLSPLYCVGNSLLIKEMKFKAIFVRGILASTISGLVAVAMSIEGYGIWALVTQVLLNQFILTVVMVFATKYAGGFSLSFKAVCEVFSFGKNVLLTEMILFLLESMRTIVVGKVYTKEELAYYDRGQMYPATLIRVVNDTLASVLLPYFSKVKNTIDVLKERYFQTLYLVTALVMPMFIGVAAVSEDFIVLFLGDKWEFAIPYMQLFCVYQAIFSFQMVSKQVLYALGVSRDVLKIEMIKSFVSLLFFLCTVSKGSLWIAGSLIGVRLVSNILYLYQVKKQIGDTGMRYTINIMVASIGMFLVLLGADFIFGLSWGRMIFKISLGIVSYLLIMLIIDRKRIMMFFPRKGM